MVAFLSVNTAPPSPFLLLLVFCLLPLLLHSLGFSSLMVQFARHEHSVRSIFRHRGQEDQLWILCPCPKREWNKGSGLALRALGAKQLCLALFSLLTPVSSAFPRGRLLLFPGHQPAGALHHSHDTPVASPDLEAHTPRVTSLWPLPWVKKCGSERWHHVEGTGLRFKASSWDPRSPASFRLHAGPAKMLTTRGHG